MPDRKITGEVVFAATTSPGGVTIPSSGIKGLQVAAFDIDPFFSEEKLGDTVETDADGKFTINYTLSASQAWTPDRNPDIVVRFHAPGGRLLHATKVAEGVSAAEFKVAKVTMHPANVKGWLATNATLDIESPKLRPTGEPVTWSSGNKIEFLKDGEKLFPALTDAVKGATQSIHFVTMNFWISKDGVTPITKFPGPTDPDPFDPFNPTKPTPGPIKGTSTVHGILLDKAKQNALSKEPPAVLVQNVPVIDQIPVLSYIFGLKDSDTADLVGNFFKNSRVKVRESSILKGFSLPAFQHAKAAIIDSTTAYVLGSTMGQSYFGADEHRIDDARHGGGLIHDVSIKVEGPAVDQVDRTFTTLWNAADSSGPTLSPGTVPAGIPGGIGVQVVRTLPGGVFTASHTGSSAIEHGETGALEAYQRAIANATKLIYIEDQYITAQEIFTSLFERMREVPALELIIVLNIEPDTAGYPERQIKLISELKDKFDKDPKLGKGIFEKRVGVYSLWSCNEKPAKYEIMPIYVHSKAAVVDDVWATIGSANLDGASLNEIELDTIFQGKIKNLVMTGGLVKRIAGAAALMVAGSLVVLLVALIKMRFSRKTQHANPQQDSQPTRSSELNLVICEKDPDVNTPNPEVVKFREALFREHLGLGTAGALPVPTPAKGWVRIWNEIAQQKLDDLLLEPAKPASASNPVPPRKKHPAKILRWTPKVRAEDYLEDLKLNLKLIKVREKADSFDFQKGRFRK